uniref:Putative extracellular protein CSOL_005 n=1 Tax=Pseudococcomyxa simplex TaxID=464287 RepID=A0A7L9QDK9_9CHLO|nr:putative extracellular protein CSOL_005 [Pseudococcomyxa simplex]
MTPILAFAVLGFIAGAHAQASQGSTDTTYYPYLESLTICTPINIYINSSTDGKYAVTVDADPAVRKALLITYQGKGLGIESFGDFQSSNPIKITFSLPPGILQYIEADYTNSDIAIDTSFSKAKGEIANNGNGRIIVSKGMDGDLVKVSTVGSGDVVINGAGQYTEIFSAGSGNRYLSGFKGQINVKHDGSGAVYINPSSDTVNIGGVNTGSGAVSYAQGNCTVRKDPDAGPPMVGDACTKVSSVSVPKQTVYWTCGIAVKGDYACGGGGLGGPPSISSIPCSTQQNGLVMMTTQTS